MSRSMSKRALSIASIAALFACNPMLVAAEDLPDPLAAGWNGEQICELLHEDAHQRILRCTFPPGVGHEKHFHKAHFGYAITGGKMRILDENGEREVEMRSGYSWTSDGVSWHEVLNIGETTSVYLIIEAF